MQLQGGIYLQLLGGVCDLLAAPARVRFVGTSLFVGSDEEEKLSEESILLLSSEESLPLVLLPSPIPTDTTSVAKLGGGNFFCFLELGSKKKDEAVGGVFFFFWFLLEVPFGKSKVALGKSKV